MRLSGNQSRHRLFVGLQLRYVYYSSLIQIQWQLARFQVVGGLFGQEQGFSPKNEDVHQTVKDLLLTVSCQGIDMAHISSLILAKVNPAKGIGSRADAGKALNLVSGSESGPDE
jgi:hypothetical protein